MYVVTMIMYFFLKMIGFYLIYDNKSFLAHNMVIREEFMKFLLKKHLGLL